ncbi:hypothetical protein HIM_09426 [Hirsutella minnesotensis 3608]|uniref:Cell wall protein n=1 Tax=Hirsutella minnesotensis 3608 TaxID=1043627 RepID=A0A0F7ZGM9_9HYPO|nr:hypothetical protein HIM_09426 [Hirsutella minnesotensis 3608]
MKASMTIVSFLLAFAAATPTQRPNLVDRPVLESNRETWDKLQGVTTNAIKTMQGALDEVNTRLMNRDAANIDDMVMPALRKIAAASDQLVSKDIRAFYNDVKTGGNGAPAPPAPAPGQSKAAATDAGAKGKPAGGAKLPPCNGKSAFDIPGETCEAEPAAKDKAELPPCNGKSAFDIPGETCQDAPTPAPAPAPAGQAAGGARKDINFSVDIKQNRKALLDIKNIIEGDGGKVGSCDRSGFPTCSARNVSNAAMEKLKTVAGFKLK